LFIWEAIERDIKGVALPASIPMARGGLAHG
jgi:hypothetical protein